MHGYFRGCFSFMLTVSLSRRTLVLYRKIPIISPGLIFVQKAFVVGLFLGDLNFGGAYYSREFCVSIWVGLDSKNS